MPTPMLADTSTVSLSREEAKTILDGLEMLLNSRRFSFKQAGEQTAQLHADLIRIVDRVTAEMHQVFGLE